MGIFMKICPCCAEEIKHEAIKCKHCGEWLSSDSNDTLHENTDNTLGSNPQKLVDDREESVFERKISKGYPGLFVLLLLYSNGMLRKEKLDYITSTSYLFGNLIELLGLPVLFIAHLALRKKLGSLKWFSEKKWLASLIAGSITFFLIVNFVVFAQLQFFHNK
jgi:hypothetical protein